MIRRLKPLFLTLTADELEYVWLSYALAKGIRYATPPSQSAEEWWDFYESQGVFHTELLAPLLAYGGTRVVIQKLTGVTM